MPINEELLTNNSAITLQGNFDTESYGNFTANSFNESCSYLVIPLFNEGTNKLHSVVMCMHVPNVIAYFSCRCMQDGQGSHMELHMQIYS